MTLKVTKIFLPYFLEPHLNNVDNCQCSMSFACQIIDLLPFFNTLNEFRLKNKRVKNEFKKINIK